VARTRPTSREWRSYYERSDRRRAIVGDPFKKHVDRIKARERMFFIATGLFFALAIVAFGVLARQ
jgi:hypothetical protein